MRLFEKEREIRRRLQKCHRDCPELCARLIMRSACELGETGYLLDSDRQLSPEENDRADSMAARREGGEPMAYLLGERSFYRHKFIVSPAVLIPRPETELMVDMALALPLPASAQVLDLGCGTGCIGLSLLDLRPEWKLILADVSISALDIARSNMQKYNWRAQLLQGDLRHLPLANNSLDLVVCNPPYVDYREEVMDEVFHYEPHLALFAEDNGFELIEAAIMNASKALRSGGWALLEHGANQGERTVAMMREYGFADTADHRDLAGISRLAVGRRP